MTARKYPPPSIPRSIRDGKPLTRMRRPLKLIDQRHRVILHRDIALAFLVDQQLIAADAETTGAFARNQMRRRRQEAPVEFALVAQRAQHRAHRLGAVAVLSGKT